MATIVRWAVAAIVLIHGLIHLLGVVKGFGWARIPQLTEPISVAGGMAWLLAGVLVLAAAALIAAHAHWWWQLTAIAAVVSQAVILTSWNDARAGTAANLVMLLAAGFGYAAEGPRSFAAEYARRAASAAASAAAGAASAASAVAQESAVPPGTPSPTAVVTEDDLAGLPGPLAAYLRRSGAVGQPRVRSFRASFHGRIRTAPDQPWMAFTGEQTSTCGRHPHRLFHITATRSGLPVDVLHAFADGTATMRGRLAYLIPFLHGAGPEMDRGETVTVLNDLCLLAPAALLDAPVTWQTLDEHRVRGSFTLNAVTVTADLVFDDDHDLIDFSSGDRLRAANDGSSFTPLPWSTPVRDHRWFGSRRLPSNGECRWHAPQPEGEFAYLEFHLDQITYDIPAAHPGTRRPSLAQ